MYRGIMSLTVAFLAIVEVIPPANSLAATPRRPPHHASHSPTAAIDYSRARDSGWIMTRPDIYITTQMVIPHNDVSGSAIAQFGLRYVGYPYTLVGNSPALGFSCIGFVSYVFGAMGIPLPDDLWNGRAYAPPVAFTDLRPGDILWFGNTVWPGLSHTAIYIGGGRFVHSAWFNIGVIVSSFHNDPRYGNYWTEHYMGATRPWGGAGSGTRSFATNFIPNNLQVVSDSPVLLVTAPYQRLRRWWSLTAPINRVVAEATPLIPLQRQGYWYKVMTPDGDMGWVPTLSHVPLLGGGTQSMSSGTLQYQLSVHGRRTHRKSLTHRTIHHSGRKRFQHVPQPRLHGVSARVSMGHEGYQQTLNSLDGIEFPIDASGAVQTVTVQRPTQSRDVGQFVPLKEQWNVATVVTRVVRTRSAHSAVVTVLGLGDAYRVLEMRDGWKRIALLDGRPGWIAGKLHKKLRHRASIHRTSRTMHPKTQAQRTTAAHRNRDAHTRVVAKLHRWAGIHSSVLQFVRAGTPMHVLGRTGTWIHVQLPNNATGYIFSGYVR
ncbi:MAG: hypothetical protein NVSMB52_06040 [Chloroflexota bacterium]